MGRAPICLAALNDCDATACSRWGIRHSAALSTVRCSAATATATVLPTGDLAGRDLWAEMPPSSTPPSLRAAASTAPPPECQGLHARHRPSTTLRHIVTSDSPVIRVHQAAPAVCSGAVAFIGARPPRTPCRPPPRVSGCGLCLQSGPRLRHRLVIVPAVTTDDDPTAAAAAAAGVGLALPLPCLLRRLQLCAWCVELLLFLFPLVSLLLPLVRLLRLVTLLAGNRTRRLRGASCTLGFRWGCSGGGGVGGGGRPRPQPTLLRGQWAAGGLRSTPRLRRLSSGLPT
jgi:hypothetical protein